MAASEDEEDEGGVRREQERACTSISVSGNDSAVLAPLRERSPETSTKHLEKVPCTSPALAVVRLDSYLVKSG
jgi:hypothetical protein